MVYNDIFYLYVLKHICLGFNCDVYPLQSFTNVQLITIDVLRFCNFLHIWTCLFTYYYNCFYFPMVYRYLSIFKSFSSS